MDRTPWGPPIIGEQTPSIFLQRFCPIKSYFFCQPPQNWLSSLFPYDISFISRIVML